MKKHIIIDEKKPYKMIGVYESSTALESIEKWKQEFKIARIDIVGKGEFQLDGRLYKVYKINGG